MYTFHLVVRSALAAILLSAFVCLLACGGGREQPAGEEATPELDPYVENFAPAEPSPTMFINQAKIDLLTGDYSRLDHALLMLDSSVMRDGPTVESHYWTAVVYTHLLRADSSRANVERCLDSLLVHTNAVDRLCEDESVPKKYRRNCDEYVHWSDSVQREHFSSIRLPSE